MNHYSADRYIIPFFYATSWRNEVPREPQVRSKTNFGAASWKMPHVGADDPYSWCRNHTWQVEERIRRREAFELFLKDGRLDIDSNAIRLKVIAPSSLLNARRSCFGLLSGRSGRPRGAFS